ILSNGRADIGTGRSTTTQELDGFGVSYETSREEWSEGLEVLVKAWTEEVMEYNGRLIQVPPRRVVPKPIQKPHPPLWMACVAPESYAIAGEKGLGALSFAMNWEQVQKNMADYHKAASNRSAPVSKVITEHFAGLSVVHVCETKEEEAIGLDGARWFMSHVADLFRPMMTKNKIYSYEYLRQLFDIDNEQLDLTYAELKQHHMVILCNPDEVVRKLETFQKGGMDQVICFKQAGRIPHANILKSLRLMAKHVLPYFNPHRTIASEPMSAAAR